MVDRRIKSIEELGFRGAVKEFIDGVESGYNVLIDMESGMTGGSSEKNTMLDWINNNISNIEDGYKAELSDRELFLQCITFLADEVQERFSRVKNEIREEVNIEDAIERLAREVDREVDRLSK